MALSPSQKTKLITEIANRLGKEDYALIDLTLKQFGFSTFTTWEGNKGGYIIALIEGAPDENLTELAKHLDFEVHGATPQATAIPDFWKMPHLRMFLSHLAAHRAYAADLQKILQRCGISCFVAHNDIVPTSEWITQIEAGLSTCDILVALLHPEFHKSNWTDQEIGFAMGRGVPVFGVRIGNDPYGFIGRFQAFNGLGKTCEVLGRELYLACQKNKQTQSSLANALVSLFAESESFAIAKDRIGMLEEMETWEPSFAS